VVGADRHGLRRELSNSDERKISGEVDLAARWLSSDFAIWRWRSRCVLAAWFGRA